MAARLLTTVSSEIQSVAVGSQIYAVLLLSGVLRAFNAPASQAFIPLLVPGEDFPNEIAWSSSIFQTATVAGPMIGGILHGVTGTPVYLYVCAGICYCFRTGDPAPR